MTEVAELRQAAAQLSEADKAELAVFLLGSLDVDVQYVEDEEVLLRREELSSGIVQGLNRNQFNEACGR